MFFDLEFHKEIQTKSLHQLQQRLDVVFINRFDVNDANADSMISVQ